MATQTERTAAHAAFTARRAFVAQAMAKHGLTDINFDIESAAASAFFDELAAYDAQANEAAPLIDVDALFPVEANAVYTCEHTENAGSPGNCAGCLFCEATPDTIEVEARLQWSALPDSVKLACGDTSAAVVAPCVTTRAMARATIQDDIAQAETVANHNRVVLASMIVHGTAQPHDHARIAFESATIDIMHHTHAALTGRNIHA